MPAKGAASAKAYLMEASTHSLGNSRGLEDGWSEGCVCVCTHVRVKAYLHVGVDMSGCSGGCWGQMGGSGKRPERKAVLRS